MAGLTYEPERVREAMRAYDRTRAENDKLRDENARLLSCLTDDAENARQILGESRALQAENAKLKSENDSLRGYIERKEGLQRFAKLVDENSKLRKLVRDMLHAADCWDCMDGFSKVVWNTSIAERVDVYGIREVDE